MDLALLTRGREGVQNTENLTGVIYVLPLWGILCHCGMRTSYANDSPQDFFDTDHPPESYGFPDHDGYGHEEGGGAHGGGDYGSSPHFKV